MFAPVLIVMLPTERILPANAVLVPSTAEPWTCQKTLQLLPWVMTTDELPEVVS